MIRVDQGHIYKQLGIILSKLNPNHTGGVAVWTAAFEFEWLCLQAVYFEVSTTPTSLNQK